MGHEHEMFWAGDFGNEYLARNQVQPETRLPFWTQIIEKTNPRIVLEVGCSRGHNLLAIRDVDPAIRLLGVDVNETALMEAADAGIESVFNLPASEVGRTFWRYADLVFTAGVLIHVPPSEIEQTMASMICASEKYVLAVEYADETEVEVEYRGHSDRLWRRPYGQLYEQLGCKLIETGEAEGFDDCRWWLLEVPA